MNIQSLPSRIVPFLKEVQLEVKKINWPTREETIRYTIIVIGISAVTAAFLGGLDYVFTQIINRFIILQ